MRIPRFQFKLRTLFIVMTAICCWMGYEAYLIQQVRHRAKLLQWMNEERYDGYHTYWRSWSVVRDDSRLSYHRKLLGDHFVSAIWYLPGEDADEVKRVREVFPEATVMAGNDWAPGRIVARR